MEEKIDILLPPTFEKSGTTKTKEEAWNSGDWAGTFNLWIIQTDPVPSIVYQQRSMNKVWAPGCLDVTVGGQYQAGENIEDGLREVREEIGKDYSIDQLTFLGRKMHVGTDSKGRMIHNIVNIFMVIDNAPISTYTLQEEEVYCVCICPIQDLIKVHKQEGYTFQANGIKNDRSGATITVSKDLFPYNWDNYHFKIALLADRFVKGEKDLLY